MPPKGVDLVSREGQHMRLLVLATLLILLVIACGGDPCSRAHVDSDSCIHSPARRGRCNQRRRAHQFQFRLL